MAPKERRQQGSTRRARHSAAALYFLSILKKVVSGSYSPLPLRRPSCQNILEFQHEDPFRV